MQELSPLAVGLIVAGFGALLAGFGWLIVSQVEINKSLAKSITDAVNEFRISNALAEERSKNRDTLCQFYRANMDSRCKAIDKAIDELKKKQEE